MKKKWVLSIVALAAVGGIALILGGAGVGTAKGSGAAKSYVYTTITTGSIEKTISTSGTIEPVSTVSVLAEMSGRAEKVFADFNDRVRKGQILVSLNTDMLKLQKLGAEAAVNKAQATYDLQALDRKNKGKLAEKGLVSDYDLETSASNLAVCAAELAAAKASLEVIETEITQYAEIKSPIDGIVLDRNVDVGQSVVVGSSSNSTSLFTLAEDLSNMEIEATVDELDIASVRKGQEVRFTIDSKPGTSFSGRVKSIHLVPETTNNVVNYYVIISAPNKDGSLMPGMTATIAFIEQKKSDILVVPNAALRFVPSSLDAAGIARKTYLAGLGNLDAEEKNAALKSYDEGLAAATKAKAGAKTTGLAGIVMGGGRPGGPGGPGTRRTAQAGEQAGDAAVSTAVQIPKKTLWYLDAAGELQCVLVEAGITDGIQTEVSGAEGLSGLRVIQREKAE